MSWQHQDLMYSTNRQPGCLRLLDFFCDDSDEDGEICLATLLNQKVTKDAGNMVLI